MLRETSHLPGLVLLLWCFLLLLVKGAAATILLIGNETVSYPSVDASFTPAIPKAGILGQVYAADPLNGCSPFGFEVGADIAAFAVVRRGDCPFEVKVRNSQKAGFTAAIVFDNANEDLVTMSGTGEGVTAHALFVSSAAGEYLLSLEGSVYIVPGYKQITWEVKWLIIVVSIVVIVIVGALLIALCCIRARLLAEFKRGGLSENLLHDDNYIKEPRIGPR